PFFVGNQEECKHIWATIRAAGARRFLPDRRLAFYLDEDAAVDIEQFDNVRRFQPARPRQAVRAPWQTFLDAVGPAAAPHASAPRNVPDEIIYAILHSPQSHMLTLQLNARTRKRTGEWGKWKPLSMSANDLGLLEPFDRETLALLHQRSYTPMIDARVLIAPATAAWWIERLARAEKLYLALGDTFQPIRWDDGGPWTFRVSIVSDRKQSSYRIEGALERNGETLALDHIMMTTNGIVISQGRASPFDDGSRGAWLHALAANGPVDVPHADAARFREALLHAPIGDLTLPEELGWELVDVRPRAVLALEHDAWSAELRGELLFVYDEWRVSSRSAEMQTTAGRKLIRRNAALEAGYRQRLESLNVIATWEGFRVRAPHLEELARTLTSEGWTLEIDKSPIRVTEEVDVEITSGIDWFDLDVHATFGDVRVALPELLAAAEAKRSMLRLSDGSFGIVPTAWAESLAPVLELGKREGDAVRFRASQALLVDAMLQTKPRSVDDKFAAMRQALAAHAPAPQKEPPTLAAELRPYQREGLGWLEFLRTTGIGGCLADDMGLGKTVQTLALLESLRANGNARPSLVVAPKSLLFNWAAEAARFAPKLRVREYHGTTRAALADSFGDCDLVLTTYATMRLDVAKLAMTEFEYVILDEAQAIKNASSLVAKASRLLRGRHRLALSGTPIENHLGELWSLFEFLNPGLLGSARSFQRTFAGKAAPAERREMLARALRPLILRRTKEQVAPELPARTEQTLYCELEGKQKKQYDELRDHYRLSLLGSIKRGGIDKARMLILEALLRLRQAACDPALIDPDTDASSAKMELLLEEIRDVVASGHRALIFSQFTSFLALVRGALDEEHVKYLYLDGQTRDRQSLVNHFQSADGPPLFLISLKAGGLGLNLTNADYIFLLDPWWNPA
ncbi:MAG TPA: SNF2-related protein, partial [Thermoanaerobaculia bacterium]|nr:SNF2-related protein [Thermoanaerobaculia bacterium]